MDWIIVHVLLNLCRYSKTYHTSFKTSCAACYMIIFSRDQAALWMVLSVRPSVWVSVRPSVTPFSRSHSTNNTSILTQIGRFGTVTPARELQLDFTDGYEIMYKARNSIEEVPCCFSMSSIKFQGYTGRKIDDLNPIWVRLLDRSQLSNLFRFALFIPNPAISGIWIFASWSMPSQNIVRQSNTYMIDWVLIGFDTKSKIRPYSDLSSKS